MVEFRGIVSLDAKGEVVCFCTQEEYLRRKYKCRQTYNCPEAIISVEIISGTRPSEQAVKRVSKAKKQLVKEVTKIKEGLGQLEKAIKDSKFKI